MTTGRINQVTIVCHRGHPGSGETPDENASYWSRAAQRPRCAGLAGATPPVAARSFHLPPLDLPARRPRTQAAGAAGGAWASHKEGLAPGRSYSATRPGGFLPSARWNGGHQPRIRSALPPTQVVLTCRRWETRYPEWAIVPEGISHIPFPS